MKLQVLLSCSWTLNMWSVRAETANRPIRCCSGRRNTWSICVTSDKTSEEMLKEKLSYLQKVLLFHDVFISEKCVLLDNYMLMHFLKWLLSYRKVLLESTPIKYFMFFTWLLLASAINPANITARARASSLPAASLHPRRLWDPATNPVWDSPVRVQPRAPAATKATVEKPTKAASPVRRILLMCCHSRTHFLCAPEYPKQEQ